MIENPASDPPPSSAITTNMAPSSGVHMPAIEVQEYRIYPFIEAIIVAAFAFSAMSTTVYFIFHHALLAQYGEINEGLIRTGSTLAAFVDGDKHRTFVSPEQESTADYKEALVPFQKVLDANPSIIYVYTNIIKDDKIYFILDPTPPGDGDDDKSHIMDPYEEAPEEMITALKEKKIVITEEPYVDRWGTFISGFIPFHDSNGKMVGVIGIDIDASNFEERLAPVKRATARAMVSCFFVSFMIGSLVWFMRNFSLIINRSRLTLYALHKKTNAGNVKPTDDTTS